MKTLGLFLILLSFNVSVWASINPTASSMPARTLKDLYQKIDDSSPNKVEEQGLVLKDYNLIVSSGTWWDGSIQAESLWEGLAEDRLRELNVIVVYDNTSKESVEKIKARSLKTQMYEYFDQTRGFYYWFSQKTLMDAVLIGPNGKILFEGTLNSPEKIEQLKALIKKKEA